MQRCCTSFCTSSHIWCYVIVRRLALPHIYDATLLYVSLHFLTYMMLRIVRRLALPRIYDSTLAYVVLRPSCARTVPDATQAYVAPKKWNTSVAPIGRVNSMWERDGRERPLMSIRAQLTMFGGWSMDPCLRIFIWRALGIQPCSMARFGRMFALGSGDGKIVPTKTSPSSLQKLWRALSAEKKRVPLRCFTYPVKSTRVLFKETELWERCKTTVICGMESMANTASVENAGSINNSPGCLTNPNINIVHLGGKLQHWRPGYIYIYITKNYILLWAKTAWLWTNPPSACRQHPESSAVFSRLDVDLPSSRHITIITLYIHIDTNFIQLHYHCWS